MLKRSPTIRYVAARRMVVDEGLVTTTGISASLPMMLALIEAIAGRAKAEAVSHDLGLEHWDARHGSGTFRLTRPFAMMDEVSLALVADAWSRTYRSNATSYAGSPEAVVTMNGVRIVPDRAGTNWPESRRVSIFPDRKPAKAFDLTLEAIAARYGDGTADVVAMQLEYPRQTASR